MHAELRVAMDWFRRERGWINEQHLKLCRVPGADVLGAKARRVDGGTIPVLGWDSRSDRSGNVVASLPGHAYMRQSVAVTAHLDTVLAPRSAGGDQALGRRAAAGARRFR